MKDRDTYRHKGDDLPRTMHCAQCGREIDDRYYAIDYGDAEEFVCSVKCLFARAHDEEAAEELFDAHSRRCDL